VALAFAGFVVRMARGHGTGKGCLSRMWSSEHAEADVGAMSPRKAAPTEGCLGRACPRGGARHRP
jgi:hypothetical protein